MNGNERVSGKLMCKHNIRTARGKRDYPDVNLNTHRL